MITSQHFTESSASKKVGPQQILKKTQIHRQLIALKIDGLRCKPNFIAKTLAQMNAAGIFQVSGREKVRLMKPNWIDIK